ncbi:MAG: hypothetical protein LIO62_06560, partial [Clostridiales bacterium]|nr:hypothetical protein [Clostridiales bacterium]
AYAYYETGKSAPKNNVLIKLAKLYRTTVDSLLNGVPQTENVNNPSIPYKEQWSTSDKLNELTDFEQIVLLKTRTMTSQERKDLLDYLTSMSKKNND